MAARALAQPAKVQRAAEPGRATPSSSARHIQPSLLVSHPNDAAEREAEATAHKVMAMRTPAVAPRERVSILAARAPAPTPAPPDESRTSPELTSAITTELGGGSGLPLEVRGYLEPRFKADLSGVRIHTDARAENLTTRLGARAFTYGRDIFFNRGQFQPDTDTGMELIAHELTHTIQQREVVQREVAVKETTGPRVQRGIISRALDWIADKANYIPGFRLFTIIIGLNPINMSKVDRSGANILRALVEFLPGGGLIVDALDNYGVFEKGGKFIEDQFRTLGMVGSMFRDALMNFIDSLGWSDIFHLGDVWDRAKRIFTDPVDRLINFGKSLVVGVITIIKDAILKPLAALVSKTRAWDLLCAVMGKNPITGEKVERSADTLIGGFMKLIGQEEIWNNIKKANAISRAWNWFKTALNGLLNLVMSIPDRFITVLKSLVIMDIVVITRVFAKVGGVFAGFIGDFLSWAGSTVLSLLEIILEVVAPAAVPYLKKAGAAFKTIIKDPIRFVRTLVRSAVQGFKQFASNFLMHLKNSLIQWLTGAMGGMGVYIPQGFTLIEILKFVLSVMGLTWTNIRAKLVKATNETTVKVLETTFDIVKTLVTEGPAAAWQKIVETLTNLQEMAIQAVMDFVKSKVVEAAVTKLLSMLSPAGAFIQAIIAIYNTIMFFVERIRQIAQVAASFIDGIAAIAAGNIAPAANRVETTMAGLLTLVISFLARIAGLGKISDAVKNLIDKIRAPIDKALDKVVDWIVATAKNLGKMLLGSDNKPVPPAKSDKPTDGELGKSISFSAPDGGHRLWIDNKGGSAELMLASTARPLSEHLDDFKTDAKQLDPPAKGNVLGAIGVALPLAKTIEKKAKSAAKKDIGAPDRDTLDKEIEGHEEALRPTLITILDDLGVRVPDKITTITCVFLRSPNIKPAAFGEYSAQLSRQAAQINAMTVHIWMERRKQFEQFSSQSDAKALDDSARKAARAALEDAMTQRLTYPMNAPLSVPVVGRVAAMAGASAIVSTIFSEFSATTQSKGLAESTARARVQFHMKGMAVLHEPDKVAGGRYDKISDIGLGSVNSDIGANWGGVRLNVSGRVPIANNVEKAIRDEMKKKKVSQAFWRKVKMDLALTHK